MIFFDMKSERWMETIDGRSRAGAPSDVVEMMRGAKVFVVGGSGLMTLEEAKQERKRVERDVDQKLRTQEDSFLKVSNKAVDQILAGYYANQVSPRQRQLDELKKSLKADERQSPGKEAKTRQMLAGCESALVRELGKGKRDEQEIERLRTNITKLKAEMTAFEPSAA